MCCFFMYNIFLFIDKVATVKSVINSSFCLVKYDQLFKPILLNVCGEWSSYKDELKDLNAEPECQQI